MWQQVEGDRVRKKCSRFAARSADPARRAFPVCHRPTATRLFLPRFLLPGQFFNSSGAASRDCLISCSENPMHAENLMQRVECHEHHSRCAIWIRDDSAMELHVVCVNLGNDERHMWIHSECRRLVDRNRIRLARDWDKVSGNVAARAEESDVDFFERCRHRVFLPGSSHRRIARISRLNAPNQSDADLRPENFSVPVRATIQCRRRRSRPRRRCDNLP